MLAVARQGFVASLATLALYSSRGYEFSCLIHIVLELLAAERQMSLLALRLLIYNAQTQSRGSCITRCSCSRSPFLTSISTRLRDPLECLT